MVALVLLATFSYADKTRSAEGRVDEAKGNLKRVLHKVSKAEKNVAGLEKNATKNQKRKAI